MNVSLPPYSQCPALFLCGRQVTARDWPSSQAARCRMTAAQEQAFGPDLFAHMPASSPRYVSTYAPSFLLGLRANRFRRGAVGI